MSFPVWLVGRETTAIGHRVKFTFHLLNLWQARGWGRAVVFSLASGRFLLVCAMACRGSSAALWGLPSAQACTLQQQRPPALSAPTPWTRWSARLPGLPPHLPMLQGAGATTGCAPLVPHPSTGLSAAQALANCGSVYSGSLCAADGTVSGRRAEPMPITPCWPKGKSSPQFQQVDRAGMAVPTSQMGPLMP